MMDPVGPWSAYASPYSRLSGASSGFQQSPASVNENFVSSPHLPTAGNNSLNAQEQGSSTNTQILLQAAHNAVNLATGQLGGHSPTPSAFNTGSFLTPPTVHYDPVFSPIFHHSNSKPAQYNSLNVNQHRQTLIPDTTVKQSNVNCDLSLRENYNSNHEQSSPFYGHQSPVSPSSPWSHQGNSQLPSPFGILPHESLGPSSGSNMSKTSSVVFEGAFSSHFPASNLSSSDYTKLPMTYSDTSSKRSDKPCPSAKSSNSCTSNTSSATSYFQHVPVTTYNSMEHLSHNFCSSDSRAHYQENSVIKSEQQLTAGSIFNISSKNYTNPSPLSVQNSQTCVTTAATASRNDKDYNVPQSRSRPADSNLYSTTSITSCSSNKQQSASQNFLPALSRAATHDSQSANIQTKIYPKILPSEHLCHQDVSLESTRSSPVGFSMMNDSKNPLSYTSSRNSESCLVSSENTTKVTLQDQQKNLVSRQPHQQHLQNVNNSDGNSNSPYTSNSYSSHLNDCPDYIKNDSVLSSSKTESQSYYEQPHSSSNNPVKSTVSDCVSNVPQGASPTSQPQASPLDCQDQSPVYPMYNNPLTTTSSPSLQRNLSEECRNHISGCSNGSKNLSNSSLVSSSPTEITASQSPSLSPSSSKPASHPSVIIRAHTPVETDMRTNSVDGKSLVKKKYFTDGENCESTNDEQKVEHRTPSDNFSSCKVQDIDQMETDVMIQSTQLEQEASVRIVSQQHEDLCSNPTLGCQTTVQSDLSSAPKNPPNLQKQDSFVAEEIPSSSAVEVVIKSPETFSSDDSCNKRRNSSGNQPSVPPLNKADVSSCRDKILDSKARSPNAHNLNLQQVDNNFSECEAKSPSAVSAGTLSSDAKVSDAQSFAVPDLGSDNCSQQKSVTVPSSVLKSSRGSNKSDVGSPRSLEVRKKVTEVTTSDLDQEPKECLKIIVPDIEDELQFLLEVNVAAPTSSSTQFSYYRPGAKQIQRNNFFIPKPLVPANGFMDSFVKFIEKDEEVPVPVQNKRHSRWPKAKCEALYKSVNNGKGVGEELKTSSSKFPNAKLNRKRKRQARKYIYETDDTESSSNVSDNYISDRDRKYGLRGKKKGKKEMIQESEKCESGSERVEGLGKEADAHESEAETYQGETGRFKGSQDRSYTKPSKRDSRKRTSSMQTPDEESSDNKENGERVKRRRQGKEQTTTSKKSENIEDTPSILPPRRETSQRKAKEKSVTKLILDDALDDLEGSSDSGDSDYDPVWTPAKDSSDEDPSNRRRSRRTRSFIGNRKKTRHTSRDNKETSTQRREKLKPPSNCSSDSREVLSDSVASEPVPQISVNIDTTTDDSSANNVAFGEVIADTNFRSGEFVVMKSELGLDFPSLWRIDGKTLLQKYEVFEQNGKKLYKNISTYSGWTPQNRHIYQQVPVKFIVQNRLETVVELLKDEICIDDQELVEKSMNGTAKYIDNFGVYIQTLVSQALDSNFLNEIFQEQDEYFLSNVKKIDEVTEVRKRILLRIVHWPTALRASVGTWPCFNVIEEPTDGDGEGAMSCVACQMSSATVRVQMYGQPYNRTTLEGCQPDPRVAAQKDFLLCNVCVGRVELYNKVAHQKYIMYVECAKKVADKRSNDPDIASTKILNELMDDETWLNELFMRVRSVWAEIDKLEHQGQKK